MESQLVTAKHFRDHATCSTEDRPLCMTDGLGRSCSSPGATDRSLERVSPCCSLANICSRFPYSQLNLVPSRPHWETLSPLRSPSPQALGGYNKMTGPENKSPHLRIANAQGDKKDGSSDRHQLEGKNALRERGNTWRTRGAGTSLRPLLPWQGGQEQSHGDKYGD